MGIDLNKPGSQDRTPVTAQALANAILDAAQREGVRVDPLKLQKLLYLVNGYHAGKFGKAWISEPFQAWDYGPVVPSIYHIMKRFGGRDLPPDERTTENVLDDAEGVVERNVPSATLEDPAGQELVDYVVRTYGSKSALYLSELTHKVDSPWHRVKVAHPNTRNMPIPDNEIVEYFRRLIH